MPTITATELARNTRKILDRVASRRETVKIERNRTVVAQIIPPLQTMTAAEAFDGLEPCLSREQAASWLRDSRDGGFDESVRDPWA